MCEKWWQNWPNDSDHTGYFWECESAVVSFTTFTLTHLIYIVIFNYNHCVRSVSYFASCLATPWKLIQLTFEGNMSTACYILFTFVIHHEDRQTDESLINMKNINGCHYQLICQLSIKNVNIVLWPKWHCQVSQKYRSKNLKNFPVWD